MEHWISQHPEIQKKYFNKWEQTNLAQRIVSLRTVRIFHRRDSYTIDTLLESQKVAPLYKNSNYIFEGEIAIIGYENVPLILLCENEIYMKELFIQEFIPLI